MGLDLTAALAMGRARSVLRLAARAVVALGFLGLLFGCGWATAQGQAKLLITVLAATAVCMLAFRQRGAFIGILLLAAMNGVPFLDTSKIVRGKLTEGDVAVLVLLVASAAWIAFDQNPHRRNAAQRSLPFAGALLLLWWLLTIMRTVVVQNVSLFHAAVFGRDFLFFALLVALLPNIRLTSRDIGVLLGTLTIGVCVFAVGQIMIATGVGHPGNLIHYEKTFQQSGVTRLYSPMTDLVDAALALSISGALMAPRRITKRLAIPIALLLLVSVIVQLTRARWIGLIAGILGVSIWLMLRGGTQTATTLRRRLPIALSALLTLGIVVALAAPGIVSGGTVVNRLLSVFSDLQTGGGTVAIREAVTRLMTHLLGGQWPVGLGFIPPSSHYYLGLPDGSIRDSDLGVLNAVMTMGAVGAVLIYLPVVLIFVRCLRSLSSPSKAAYAWLRYGGAVWLLAALLSSITLVTLFSTGGLTLTALIIAAMVNPNVSGATATSATYPPRAPAVAMVPAR